MELQTSPSLTRRTPSTRLVHCFECHQQLDVGLLPSGALIACPLCQTLIDIDQPMHRFLRCTTCATLLFYSVSCLQIQCSHCGRDMELSCRLNVSMFAPERPVPPRANNKRSASGPPSTSSTNPKRPKDKGTKKPRPPTAYNLWSKDNNGIAMHKPHLIWKSLPALQKLPYEQAANKLKEAYRSKYRYTVRPLDPNLHPPKKKDRPKASKPPSSSAPPRSSFLSRLL